MEHPDGLVPPRYIDAETSESAVEQWAVSILTGGHARLLLVGPSWSGKTHCAYAAIRRLLLAGYPPNGIAFYKSFYLGKNYERSLIDHGPPVIVIDDVTLGVDLEQETSGPRAIDSPEIQAMMAAEDAAVAEAVQRLVSRSNASWILCASSMAHLKMALGGTPPKYSPRSPILLR